MFGLPKSTEINKPLSKKGIFDKFKPSPGDRKLFDEQVSRMAIVGEISPHTASLAPGAVVHAIYIILVTLKVPDCSKKNIVLLSKLIDQRMVFALQYQDSVRLAVYRADQVFISDSKPAEEWKISLTGLDIGAVWDNLIAEIAGIEFGANANLDQAIAETARQSKLAKQVADLEKKAMYEQQPRRKWEYVNRIRELKDQLYNG